MSTIPIPDFDPKFLRDLLEYATRRICVVCEKAHTSGRLFTCSEKCHKKFIEDMERKFGPYKKVVDEETGKAYKVPTRLILEQGLKHEDLKKFPRWKEESH
jgi:hypothetical protein